MFLKSFNAYRFREELNKTVFIISYNCCRWEYVLGLQLRIFLGIEALISSSSLNNELNFVQKDFKKSVCTSDCSVLLKSCSLWYPIIPTALSKHNPPSIHKYNPTCSSLFKYSPTRIMFRFSQPTRFKWALPWITLNHNTTLEFKMRMFRVEEGL